MKLAFVTDIHEDHHSLSKAMEMIHKKDVDEIVCLGDIVGYTMNYSDYSDERNARICLQLIQENCEHIILGNHDMHAARMLPQYSNVFAFPKNWYQMDVYQKELLSDGSIWLPEKDELDPMLQEMDIDFIKTLEEFKIQTYNGYHVLFSHYIYPNLSGLHKHFKKRRKDLHDHFAFMDKHQCRLSFTGHGHYTSLWIAEQHQQKISKPRFVGDDIYQLQNPISHKTIIGVPAITRNGTSGFCIFDTEALSLQYVPL